MKEDIRIVQFGCFMSCFFNGIFLFVFHELFPAPYSQRELAFLSGYFYIAGTCALVGLMLIVRFGYMPKKDKKMGKLYYFPKQGEN